MARRGEGRTGLPTGTVTFLFTDIEGSTRLLDEFGDAYESLLGRHSTILRRAIGSHDGTEVGTEGDAFFAVFTSPLDALEAAVEAQRDLDAEPWTDGASIRVRMGVHTGHGRLGGDDYVGMDVHRAARIASAAHGGQILVSAAVRGLVAGTLPEGLTTRDLGRYRLKDLPEPEHLYQLEGPALRSGFPPLRGSADVEGHLPTRRSTFVGRGVELAELERLLGHTRLLTLTGAGGSGKTTLALEIARRHAGEYADGAWFIDLAGVREPDEVRGEIARGLGLRDGAIGPAAERLTGFVSGRELLIVVDNFEQVIAAAHDIAGLIEASEHSSLVVTSRTPLRLAAEQEYPVRPFGLGRGDRDVDPDAVELFVDRARLVRPDLRLDAADREVVDEICTLVDGLPLGIELAAARVSALPLVLIRDRLRARLSLPGGGPRDLPARQQTVEAAVDWSRDLLPPDLRVLFDHLAVFAGTFDLEQVEQVIPGPPELGVTALEGLYELVERSLVLQAHDDVGGARFDMLETVRARARSHLADSGAGAAPRDRHLRAYADLAERSSDHVPGPEQAFWLDRLGADEANLHAALHLAIESQDVDAASVLLRGMWRSWLAIGRLSEMRELVHMALSLPGADLPTASRLRTLEAAGSVAYWSGDLPETLSFYEQRVSLAEEIGGPSEQGRAWLDLFYARAYGGDTDGASTAIDTALQRFEDAGDESGVVRVEGARDTTLLLSAIHDLPSVRSEIETTARRRESSSDPAIQRIGHVLRGVLALLDGDADAALGPAAAALRHDVSVRDSAEAVLDLQAIAAALRLASRPAEAAVMDGAADAAVERLGVRPVFADLLERTIFANRGPGPTEPLGQGQYDDEVDRGRRMSIAEAAGFALRLTEPDRDGDVTEGGRTGGSRTAY